MKQSVDAQNAKSDVWVHVSKESLGLRYNLGSCQYIGNKGKM